MPASVAWDHQVRSDKVGAPPRWVARLLGQPCLRIPSEATALIERGEFALVFARLPQAVELTALELQRHTAALYESVARTLAKSRAPHPIRFWNFIPQLNDPVSDAMDRYMVFSAGRFAAFSRWFGSPQTFADRVPAASGVGHEGDDLLVWCLAASAPGTCVENPWQLPGFNYSAQYGPLPPCFSRAMIIHGYSHSRTLERHVLVSGTASIRGEDTQCDGQLLRQTHIALQNLAIVVKAARESPETTTRVNGDSQMWLDRYQHIRTYHVKQDDRSILERLLIPRFSNAIDIEWVHAPLCRRDLLVEIEGVATLGDG